MRMSRCSPASSATRSQCRPAQLIRKPASNSPAVVSAIQPAPLGRRSFVTRAPVTTARRAPASLLTSAAHTRGVVDDALPAARAAPPLRPRAVRSRASHRGPAAQAFEPVGGAALLQILEPRHFAIVRRHHQLAADVVGNLVLAAELHHAGGCPSPPAAPSPNRACSKGRSAARRCCARSDAGPRRLPFPARGCAHPESARQLISRGQPHNAAANDRKRPHHDEFSPWRVCDILPRMPRCIYILLAAASCVFAQSAPPEIRFDYSDPLHLPEGMNLGEAAGVAVNSKGHIFVYQRGGHTQLFEFDPNGKFIREIGKDLYGFAFAHVVRIDKDDNIWCVDEGSNMVIEFNPAGRVIMLLGRKPEAVEGGPARERAGGSAPGARQHFNRPTDVTWDRRRQRLHHRRLQQLARGEGRQGRRLGQGVGQARHRARRLPHPAQHRHRRQGQRLRRRPREPPHPGVRLRRQVSDSSSPTCGAPWAICITPGPKQVLYSSDSRMPGRILQAGSGRQHSRDLRQGGKRPGNSGGYTRLRARRRIPFTWASS